MCYPFFGFMRNLVTNLCAKIASILGSNNMMDMIVKGFLATSNRNRQMFYFRVIRTAILLDSRMIIRILAQQPWLSIIWRGLTSKHRFTIFASKSLWQLMSHTSAEVVLKAQFIKIGPKAFCELFLQATPMATAFFERVIKSFRNVGNTCSYVAIPLSQYQQYLDCFLHIAPKDNRQMSIMRFRILELLKDNDCITASTDEEIYAVVNKFAESWVPTVVSNTNLYDIGSLKVLFLFRFLNQTIVANPTLWRSILGYMNSPQGSISLKQRKEAWQTFENAILNQEMFGTFLSESSDIFQTVVSAFVSPPPGLHPFPVNSALKFARALNEQGPSGAVSIKNLDILFRALANPDANFGKILLMVFNGIGAGYGCRIQVNQFVAELLKARGDSPLREFFSRRHMEGPIGTIIKSVKSTQSSVQ